MGKKVHFTLCILLQSRNLKLEKSWRATSGTAQWELRLPGGGWREEGCWERACLVWHAQEPGTVLPLHTGELLRDLPEEYFSSELTGPAYGTHGGLMAHVNSP